MYIYREDLEKDDVECIWVVNKCKQRQPVLISSIYRPPSSCAEFIDKLGDIIDMASCEHKAIIVTGDFNCDVSENDASVNSDPITSCCNLFQMTQLIHEPPPPPVLLNPLKLQSVSFSAPTQSSYKTVVSYQF